MAFPATWGDELVAEGCLRHLATNEQDPAILAACPHVIDLLTRAGGELMPHMIVLAAPPVAAARYLRAAFAQRTIHITYVGSCPSAADPSIDARLDPGAFLDALAERGIVLAELPEFFESVLPPDRRRYRSLPGGVPSAEQLAADDPRRALVELEGEDFLVELAQRLLTRQHALIDVSLAAGCACAGSVRGARATLVALEPPRAHGPVVDPRIGVDLAPASSPNDPAERAVAAMDAPHDVAPAATPNAIPVGRTAAAPAVRHGAAASVPRAFAAHRALAKRRERAPVVHPPTTYSTRPRIKPAATSPAIPLATDRPAFVPPAPPPPPPPKMRTAPADQPSSAPTNC